MYRKYFKRLLDIFLSVSCLVILFPVFILLALWIKLDSKGPVLFKQKRVGKGKVYFKILKFRTMRINAPHDMPTHMLSSPDSYITRSGKFLRKTSLDELPQIWNILVGQMSFVGPRPALWNQVDLIAARDKVGANEIRPGLTGWAQINGRDELEINMKARLDGEYIHHLSLWFDFKCIMGTASSVLKRDGIVEGGTGVIKHAMRKAE